LRENAKGCGKAPPRPNRKAGRRRSGQGKFRPALDPTQRRGPSSARRPDMGGAPESRPEAGPPPSQPTRVDVIRDGVIGGPHTQRNGRPDCRAGKAAPPHAISGPGWVFDRGALALQFAFSHIPNGKMVIERPPAGPLGQSAAKSRTWPGTQPGTPVMGRPTPTSPAARGASSLDVCLRQGMSARSSPMSPFFFPGLSRRPVSPDWSKTAFFRGFAVNPGDGLSLFRVRQVP